jgi:NAD(P)-dependent dehydrogenase (short-subunit alcohol dehydrogenase family)
MDGRLVVVTGSSSGIGQGIVKLLAEAGADVAGIDWLDGSETRERVGDKFTHHQADVSSPADVARAFSEIDAKYGRAPWGLVCCAGIFPIGSLLNYPVEQFDKVFAVNVRGVFLCVQEAGRRMRDAGGGRIVNIASTASVQSWWRMAAYDSSKGAVAQFTRSAANELARFNITVNAVGPGSINTGANGTLVDEEFAAAELARTPIKRFGEPRDVAVAVRFFLQPEADWVTGQVLFVDGGFLACGGPVLPRTKTRDANASEKSHHGSGMQPAEQ